MKPNTKKTLIIAVVVAVVAVTLWLLFRGSKKTAKGMINRLNTSRYVKNAIIGYLEKAKLEQDINANAESNNCTYEQALALTAAYYLVNDGIVDDATWQQWKSEIFSM